MGYVYVRQGKCYIAYRRPDGRWVRESAGTDKRTLAKALLSKKEQEMLKAEVAGVPVQSDIRLDEFVEEYLRYAQANKKPSSVERDETSLTHLLPVFGKMKLRDITSGAVQRYVDDRRLTKRKNGKRIRAATIANEVHTLSAIFREAVRRDVVFVNPVSRVKKPKEDNTIIRYLLPEEEERLIPALPERLRPMVVFDLNTGLRKGELLRLKWADVDLDQQLVLVKDSKTDKRYVPINGRMTALLKELKENSKSEFVFVDPASGEAINDIERAWRKALRTAKVTGFRFHDLRHTFASRLVQTGSDVQHVKDLLGHKNITTTERYAHLRPVDLREAVEKLPTQPGEEKTPPKDPVEKPRQQEGDGK